MVRIEGYKGLVARGEGHVVYDVPEGSGNSFHFVQTGTTPATLFFWGATFWYPPVFDIGPAGTLQSLESQVRRNGFVPVPVPNTTDAATMKSAKAPFEALRALRDAELSDFGL